MKKRSKIALLHSSYIFPIVTLVMVLSLLYFSEINYNKLNFSWKNIRSEIKDSVISLDKYGTLTNGVIGIAGLTPQQWHRQNWIIDNSTESELLSLTDYPSGTVKGLAYKGLIIKNHANQYELLKKSLNDTLTFVHYTSGCIGSGFMLSEYILEYEFVLDTTLVTEKNSRLNLTSSQRTELIGILNKRKKSKHLYKNLVYN